MSANSSFFAVTGSGVRGALRVMAWILAVSIVVAAQAERPARLPREAQDADLARLVAENPALRKLDLRGCSKLRDFAPLGRLTELREIQLPHGRSSGALRALAAGAHKLEVIRGIGRIRAAAPLASFPLLRKLVIPIKSWALLVDIARLARLEHLEIRCEEELEDSVAQLAPLGALERLRVLQLNARFPSADLEGLRPCRRLQELNLSSAPNLDDLSVLADLQDLETLEVDSCPALRDLSPLEECVRLKSLWLNAECYFRKHGISHLEPLTHMPCLQSLGIGSPSIRELGVIGRLNRLQHLGLHGALHLQDLGPIAKLSRLEEIHLTNCYSVRDLAPLHGLRSLRMILIQSYEKPFAFSAAQIAALRKAHPPPCVVAVLAP